MVSQPFGFQAQTASNRAISLSAQVVNAATGLPILSAGTTAIATVLSTPFPLSSSALLLFWNDRQLPILSVNGSQLTFQIPVDAASGQNTLRVDAGGQRGLAIGVAVDPAPPLINAVSSIFNQPVDAARPGYGGSCFPGDRQRRRRRNCDQSDCRRGQRASGSIVPAAERSAWSASAADHRDRRPYILSSATQYPLELVYCPWYELTMIGGAGRGRLPRHL